MKIALAQINTTVGDIHGNRDRIIQALGRARDLGADIAVFPELCLTGYPPRDLLGLHGFVEANLRAVEEIAAHSGSMGVVVGFVDRNPKKEGRDFYNAAAFLAEGKIQAVVHKTLLPTYDVFDEDRYFESADERPGGPVPRTDSGNFHLRGRLEFGGFLVASPLCRPIRSATRSSKAPTFSSIFPHRHTKWESPGFASRCFRTTCGSTASPLVYVNLVGGNDDLLFDGNSLALGKNGNVIAQGRSFAEDLLIVDTESDGGSGISGRRKPGKPVSSPRDGHAGLRAQMRLQIRRPRDSAAGSIPPLSPASRSEALGADNVLGVSMPSMYSRPESF